MHSAGLTRKKKEQSATTFFTYNEKRLSRVSKTPSGKKVMTFEDKSLQNILSSKSKTMTFIRLQVTFYQYTSTHTHTSSNIRPYGKMVLINLHTHPLEFSGF